jgi:hypothetical protein
MDAYERQSKLQDQLDFVIEKCKVDFRYDSDKLFLALTGEEFPAEENDFKLIHLILDIIRASDIDKISDFDCGKNDEKLDALFATLKKYVKNSAFI